MAPKRKPVEFRDVVGYEDLYEVSLDGGVWRKAGTPLNPGLRRRLKDTVGSGNEMKRYYVVRLCREGKARTHSVHELIARAFHGPRPAGCDVHHKNENGFDNRAENLEYKPKSEHARLENAGGCTRERRHALTDADVREIRRAYIANEATQLELAVRYGVSSTCVNKIVNYKRRRGA